MAENRKNDLMATNSTGSITYANDVIAIIAGLAAGEVKGVAGMTGGGLSELLGKKESGKGIRVTLSEDDVIIEINLSMFYGIRIQDACQQVQINVKKAVENMTGLTVKEVNVNVLGIQFDKDMASANTLDAPDEEDIL